MDDFLKGHNIVLQAEEHNGEALINAVMASTAQHPMWLIVLDLMQERAVAAHNVLYATGKPPLGIHHQTPLSVTSQSAAHFGAA